MTIHEFCFPTTVRFGSGARHELPTALSQRGWQRPLLVSDRQVAQLPFCQEMVTVLTAAGLKPIQFSDLGGNPVKSQVVAGVATFQQQQADSIVALGGGAALDVAKAIALMAHHPGDLFDYEDGKPLVRPVDRPLPGLVALPTTAGTGSEVGRSSVIADDATQAKKIIFSPRLLPALILADPELLVGLPPAITAATGMDALTHCVEAYLAQGFHPMCDGIAVEGVRLVGRHLRRSVAQGDDLEARGGMLAAAMMGGVAFQKGLGVTHSCAHALSTVYDLHHGLANALMITAAMEFNQVVVAEKLATLATAVGATPTAAGFIDWLEALKADIGIPTQLGAVGVMAEQLERLVAIAVTDGCHQLNPRSCTTDDLRALYQAAGIG
ncbi:MAG: iron-containing alcohol dehydrogenase [Spirulinaceae cyanobacterium SM2_1_0]|nr:iron-containing alcohol dehydrogenase [Spirulinaceae cyanobacterium SM2_1_0]